MIRRVASRIVRSLAARVSRFAGVRAAPPSDLVQLLEESGLFDRDYYHMMMNAAGESLRISPVIHYLTRGAAEGFALPPFRR